MMKYLRSLPVFFLLLQPIISSAQSTSNKEQETAGATLFRDKGCAYCHGATGQGTQKGPSLANVRKTLKAPQIASQIQNGGQKMPAFEDSLSHDEVLQLVAYLRAKHRPNPAPVPTPSPAPPQPAAK